MTLYDLKCVLQRSLVKRIAWMSIMRYSDTLLSVLNEYTGKQGQLGFHFSHWPIIGMPQNWLCRNHHSYQSLRVWHRYLSIVSGTHIQVFCLLFIVYCLLNDLKPPQSGYYGLCQYMNNTIHNTTGPFNLHQLQLQLTYINLHLIKQTCGWAKTPYDYVLCNKGHPGHLSGRVFAYEWQMVLHDFRLFSARSKPGRMSGCPAGRDRVFQRFYIDISGIRNCKTDWAAVFCSSVGVA